jgi:hypothetical protein
MERNEIADFVRLMEPKDHVVMFYSKPEDKRQVLFTYLKAGLDKGEAAAYVTAEETPEEVRAAMRRFGIEVDLLEESGALHVMSCADWYFKDGVHGTPAMIELWKALYDNAMAKGSKGFRVTGEMTCFSDRRMIKKLMDLIDAHGAVIMARADSREVNGYLV